MKRSEVTSQQKIAEGAMHRFGFPVEAQAIEIADFGKRNFPFEGLAIVVLVNDPSAYCGKLLLMTANQLCPLHRHPPIPQNGQYEGKQETFVVLRGSVLLAVWGMAEPCTPTIPIDEAGRPLADYTVPKGAGGSGLPARWLKPGESYTIPRDRPHWFRAGGDGVLILEISTPSDDAHDIFYDPAIVRCPPVDED